MSLTFEQVTQKLDAAQVPCHVLETESEIQIHCGSNYPEEIVDRIYNALGEAAEDRNIGIMAGSNFPYSRKVTIAGGSKNYWHLPKWG